MNKSDIENYFNAEKSESLLFIVIGALAILAAVLSVFVGKTPFAKGMAIPLISVALIQLTVGLTVWRRSDSQRIEIVYALDMDRAKLKQEELPRMAEVMKNFVIYRWVEIFLLISAMVLVYVFRDKIEGEFWFGIGVGLAIQTLLMLIADHFAEKRGQIYLDQLQQLFK